MRFNQKVSSPPAKVMSACDERFRGNSYFHNKIEEKYTSSHFFCKSLSPPQKKKYEFQKILYPQKVYSPRDAEINLYLPKKQNEKFCTFEIMSRKKKFNTLCFDTCQRASLKFWSWASWVKLFPNPDGQIVRNSFHKGSLTIFSTLHYTYWSFFDPTDANFGILYQENVSGWCLNNRPMHFDWFFISIVALMVKTMKNSV